MAGFGGDPVAGLVGSIPGAILQAQAQQRALEDRELQRRKIEQALNIANAAESRASQRHPLTLEGDRLANEATGLGIESDRRTLDRQRMVDPLLEEAAGAFSTGDPLLDLLIRPEIIAGDTSNAVDALTPFGLGKTPETIEEAAAAGARGRRRGAPPIRGTGGGGGGGQPRITDIRALVRAEVQGASPGALLDMETRAVQRQEAGLLTPEEAIALEEIRSELQNRLNIDRLEDRQQERQDDEESGLGLFDVLGPLSN